MRAPHSSRQIVLFWLSIASCLSALAADTKITPAPDASIVNMDTLVVSAGRYHWQYAKSAHFEILSNFKDEKFLPLVIQKAEQVIALFEKNSPLYCLQRDVPAKVIIVGNQGFDRFFTSTGNEINLSKQSLARSVTLGKPVVKVDGEQLAITHIITESYMSSSISYAGKVRENAFSLIALYLEGCLLSKQIPPESIYVSPFTCFKTLNFARHWDSTRPILAILIRPLRCFKPRLTPRLRVLPFISRSPSFTLKKFAQPRATLTGCKQMNLARLRR